MRQITVVARYSQSLIADITGLLATHGEDIRNLDSHVVGEDAYVKLVVENYDASLRLLTDAGYNAVSDDSVVLRTVDRPGALALVARTISEKGINIRAVTMLQSHGGYTVVAVGTDDNDQVRELFKETLVS